MLAPLHKNYYNWYRSMWTKPILNNVNLPLDLCGRDSKSESPRGRWVIYFLSLSSNPFQVSNAYRPLCKKGVISVHRLLRSVDVMIYRVRFTVTFCLILGRALWDCVRKCFSLIWLTVFFGNFLLLFSSRIVI